MAKFHDEFFRQTEGEDELVMKCVTKEGLQEMAERIVSLGDLCTSGNRDFKNMECEIAIKGDEIKRLIPKDGYLLRRDDYPSKDTGWKILNVHTTGETEIKIKIDHYERELICRSSAFIVGYADLLLKITVYVKENISFDNPLNKGEIMTIENKWSFQRAGIVEVKPHIKDTAAVLRQIKTYLSLYAINARTKWEKKPVGVIVSYSEISNQLTHSLHREGVAYIRMEPPVIAKSPNGLDNFIEESE